MTYGIAVQSHLSENPGEIEFVRFLRSDNAFYGDAYNNYYDLFGKNDDINTDVKTVMAHCVWSAPEEVDLMRKNGVFVAHCPVSDMNLSSGIAPILKFDTSILIPGTSTPLIYPYFFANLETQGVAGVVKWAVLMFAAFMAVGFVFYGIDRILNRKGNR